MPELDHRHAGKAKLAGGHDPAMAGDDAAGAVDQDRVGEAEGPDRTGNQRHLFVRMGPGIAGEGNEGVQRPVLDAKAKPGHEGGKIGPFLGL